MYAEEDPSSNSSKDNYYVDEVPITIVSAR
jgi:hypothetical protein